MPLGWNLCLCNDDLIADRAVLALSLAGFGASRLNSRINDLGMSLGRDFFLSNEYSIADRAVLAFGQTSLSAGWSLCCIDYFCVAGRGDFFHTGENRITNGALRTGCMTSLGAGSGLFRNFNRGMPGCIDCFGLGCIANCAGVGLDAGILTGRRGRDLALIPTVALGRNLFLRFDNRSADRAADAIRQTRFGTGCGLAHNGLLGVAGRRDLSLRNDDCVADGAVLAFRLAWLRAGRLDPCVNDLGVALGLNGFTLGDFLAADGADCITGVAILGAGDILLVDHLGERMVVLPLGIKSGVLGQINSRTIRIGVASTIGRRIPVQEVVAFTGERVCVQCGIGLRIYGLWGHRAFDRVFCTAVGFKGNRQLRRRFTAPNAIDIVDNIVSACGRGFGVRAVGVVQLGSGDGDLMCRHVALLRVLIRLGLRSGGTLLVVDASTCAGADVCAACGGVDTADSGQRTVDVHLYIRQRSTLTCPSGGNNYRHVLCVTGTAVAAPLIHVVDVDALAAGHHQLGALGDGGLHAGQQRRILIDHHISRLDINSNVVGDWQYVACRVNAHACKL